MNWDNLTTYVMKKAYSGSSASTPVANETVYFELYDKGIYFLYEKSAVTNSKGAAILNNVSGTNSEEYWYSFIYHNGRGLPTPQKTMDDNVSTIIIIESASTNTWDDLEVYVGQRIGYSGFTPIDGTLPLSSRVVEFNLQKRNGGRPTILSGMTNKLGYATVTNNGTLNDVIEWSAGTSYNNVYYTSQNYEITATTGNIIITDTNPAPKDDEILTRLTVYTRRSNSQAVTGYVCCFLYDANNNLKHKLTGTTTLENGSYRIDFNIQALPSYTNLKSVRINAYNATYNIAYISTGFETIAYDSETGTHSFVAYMTSQSKGYSGKITEVASYDLLYHYIDNTTQYGANPWTLKVKLTNSPYTQLLSAHESNTIYPSTPNATTAFTSTASPYVTFESTPDATAYTKGVTSINLIDYPLDSNLGVHVIGRVNIYCAKTNGFQIENPVVIDTEEKDLDSPVYNLPNVTMTYKYVYDGRVVWTFTASSNSEYTTFNIPQDIEGGINTFLKTLAGKTSHKVTRTLSKHQYDDITSYVFVSASTIPISYESHEVGQMFFYFCKYTSNGGTITRFPLPQRYLHIKRETDVCYRSDMFNDYVRGFDYEYHGNVLTAIGVYDNTTPADRGGGDTPRSGETVFPIVSAFTLTPSNKIIVARKEFYSGCGLNISPQVSPANMQTVQNYKKFFVSPAISRVEYLTRYTNLPDPNFPANNDMFFDVNNGIYSAHSYTEHMQSLWPVEGQWWNYLEFYPTANTTGSVTLYAENMEEREMTTTLQYSYWGDRWEFYKIGTTIELLEGTNVRFRNAQNVTSFSWVEENGQGVEDDVEKYYHFVVEGDKMCVKGNLSSLINVSGRGYTVTGEYSFLKLFYESNIYYAKDLIIDPTSVPEGCYYNMFRDCGNLTVGPEKINATSGGLACMGHMFRNCREMTNGPLRIKLRTYEEMCCTHMFADCSKLVYPPLFTYNTQQNTFGKGCFGKMFIDCVSLKEPTMNPDQIYSIEYDIENPERDSYGCAWQLGDTAGNLFVGENSCYEMFKGCSSLQGTPIFKPSYVSGHGCYSMFSACTKLSSVRFSMPFEKSTVEEDGCAYMFDNCWNIETLQGVALSATELSDRCYFHMFDTCKRLVEKLPCIQATRIPDSGCAYMYRGCYQDFGYINQFITEDFEIVGSFGMAHMFECCTCMDFYVGKRDLYYKPSNRLIVMDGHEILNHGKIVYEQLNGDTSERYYVYIYDHYNDDDELVATNIGTVDMYSPYFDNDYTLNSSYEYRHTFYYLYLRATTLNDSCYSHMFSGCTGLHYAHHFVLDATVLANRCYEYMFCNCSNLFSVPLCFSGITSYAASACQWMFAFDGDFQANNSIRNQVPESNWRLKESNFNYIYPACGETAYSTEYYLYKNGLRSVQCKYNYYFQTSGAWKRNNEGYSTYAFVNNSGLNYNSKSSESHNLIDVTGEKSIALKSGAYVNAYNCFSHMFYGCKGLKESHFIINNAYVRDSMFESMFNCCYSLTKAPTFNTQTTGPNVVSAHGFAYMFKDCHEMLNLGCNNGILRSETIRNNAYYMMYKGCYKIITGPRIYATNIGEAAMAHMFNCCYRLTGITNNMLPSINLNKNCYYGMFAHCFSLVKAPSLPATVLSAGCYSYMFNKACLYYYTGYTMYSISATCHNNEQGDCPATANGKCTLSGYHIVDDTGHNTLDTDWKMGLEYFGNYFYDFASFQYAGHDTPGHGMSLPEPYDVYAHPYGNLTDEKYLREETDLDYGYEPHTTSTSELPILIAKYFWYNDYTNHPYEPDARTVISSIHKYTWAKGNGDSNELRVLKSLISNGVNPIVHDSNGLPNDSVSFNYYKDRTKTYNVTISSGGTFQYDFPYFLDKTSIESLNTTLTNVCGATSNYVKNLYKLYQVYIRYRVSAYPQEQETSSGYSLNYMNDDTYKVNKKIRDERWYTWNHYYNNSSFFIPVNDRSEVWNQSLSSLTISATSLSTDNATGMFQFLNLKANSVLHAPGSSSNYRPILPSNWSVTS